MVLSEKNGMNERLIKAISFVPKCRCMADIGSDHGYAAVYAVQNGIAETVTATDISAPSLAKTQKITQMYGLADKITCRVGDGLKPVLPGEAQVAFIAGMGADLIAQIIESSPDVARELDCMVLQPMNSAEPLRRRIVAAGYKIDAEGIVKDNGRFYQILKCSVGTTAISDIQYELGTYVYRERIPLCTEFIEHMLESCDNILRYIGEEDTCLSRARTEEVLRKKEEYRRALEWAMSE